MDAANAFASFAYSLRPRRRAGAVVASARVASAAAARAAAAAAGVEHAGGAKRRERNGVRTGDADANRFYVDSKAILPLLPSHPVFISPSPPPLPLIPPPSLPSLLPPLAACASAARRCCCMRRGKSRWRPTQRGTRLAMPALGALLALPHCSALLAVRTCICATGCTTCSTSQQTTTALQPPVLCAHARPWQVRFDWWRMGGGGRGEERRTGRARREVDGEGKDGMPCARMRGRGRRGVKGRGWGGVLEGGKRRRLCKGERAVAGGKCDDFYADSIITSCLPFSLLPSPYSLLPSPYSLLPTPYSLLPTPYSLLPSPYSLLPTPYSLLPPFYSLLPTPYSLFRPTHLPGLPLSPRTAHTHTHSIPLHAGIATIRERRANQPLTPALLAGPGKLLDAPPVASVLVGPRVGIDYAEPCDVALRWRFASGGTPSISNPKQRLQVLSSWQENKATY
ncbi:unnamed protein product [Closterium sp. NIES-53]